MPKDVNEIISKLPKKRQKKIRKRAEELGAVQMTLQAVRKLRGFTQEEMAKALDIGQDSVSRFERSADPKFSSLFSYIRALGGEPKFIIDFPDLDPIEVSGFPNFDED